MTTKKARIDPSGTAKPRTRLVAKVDPAKCIKHGPVGPAATHYEAEDGERTPLGPGGMGGGLASFSPELFELYAAWFTGEGDGLDWNQLRILMSHGVLVMGPTGPRLASAAVEAFSRWNAARSP